MSTFDDSLDFRFVDETNFEDDVTGVDESRKAQLANDAMNVAIESWLAEKAADQDQARADAMGEIPPPPEPTDDDPDPEDPHAEERAKKEQLLSSVQAGKDRAKTLAKSYSRKKTRLAEGGVTITKSQLDNAKKAFLVGQVDQQGNGTGGRLAQWEQEFIQHRQNRRRALAALALTGALALNDQERAEMERRVRDSENAMETLRSVIQTFRKELKAVGGNLPSTKEGAPAGQKGNRASRRLKPVT